MLKAIGQNAVLLGALGIAATASGMAAPLVLDARGAFGPSLLGAESFFGALAAVVIALGVSTALAILVGRVCNTVVGLFVLGGGLYGLAWRMETIAEFAHLRPGGGPLGILAVETFLWAILVLLATVVVFKASGPLHDVEPLEDGKPPDPLFSGDAMRSAAAGLIVIPIVWFVAQSTMKAQVIGAVFCGSMIAGLVGRLMSPHVQPILIFASPVLFGAVGHIAGAVLMKKPLEEAFTAGTVNPLSLPMPTDYAAGALMGVAVGIGWRDHSFIRRTKRSIRARSPRVRRRSSAFDASRRAAEPRVRRAAAPFPLVTSILAMISRPTLETERLILRPFTPDDAPVVRELAGERDIASTTWRIPHPYPEGAAEEWIATHETRFVEGTGRDFAIIVRDGSRFAGGIGLEIAAEHRHAEVGYWIAKPCWGHGYATDATCAIVDYAFRDLAMNRVHAHHMTRNPASGRVLENAGMREEGVLRQHICKWDEFEDMKWWGILRSEWEAQQEKGQ